MLFPPPSPAKAGEGPGKASSSSNSPLPSPTPSSSSFRIGGPLASPRTQLQPVRTTEPLHTTTAPHASTGLLKAAAASGSAPASSRNSLAVSTTSLSTVSTPTSSVYASASSGNHFRFSQSLASDGSTTVSDHHPHRSSVPITGHHSHSAPSGSGSVSRSGSAASLLATSNSSPAARPQSMAASVGMSVSDDTTRRVASSSSLSVSVGGSHYSHIRRPSTPGTPSSPPTRTSSLVAGVGVARANYVQAIHDFDPSIMPTGALTHNMYLSFKGGEVIRVHGRDPSGWWDGEVSRSGQTHRGWFPSNYVREVDWDEVTGGRSPSAAVDNSRPGSNMTSSANDSRSRHTSVMSYGSHASHLSQQSSHHSSGSHFSRVSHSATDSESSNPFGPPPNLSPGLQALFQPIVQSLTLLQTSIQDGNLSHIQPSTAAVISAIRIALVRMDCMARDSPVLSANPVLSKERRYVLAELSKLVACAKLTADSETDTDAAAALESTGKAARSVFSWVRRFMVHASEAGVTALALDSAEQDSPNPNGSSDSAHRLRMRTTSASSRIGHGSEAMKLKSASISDLRAAARRQGSGAGAPPLPSGASASTTPRPGSRAGTATMSPSLGAGSGRSSPGLSSRTRASFAQRHTRSASFDHYGAAAVAAAGGMDDSPDLDASSEMSHSTFSHGTMRRRGESSNDHETLREFTSGVAVHEAIAAAEDALLSIIASFIGHIHSHHIDSHPSSHAYLIELTRETVDRVRDLLTIVEAVGRQAGSLGVLSAEVENLRSARAELYHATTHLVEGAEAVANAPFAEGGSEAYDMEKAELLQVTTTTLRAGTECARVVRTCVPEDPGDSDYDSQSVESTSRYSGVGLGIRGPHAIATLSRRATSLGHLHRRYQQDAVYASHGHRHRVDDDNEEIVADESGDEEQYIRRGPRPSSHPPEPRTDTRRSSDSTMRSRSRASSMSAPKRLGHKSGSSSADLDKDASETGSNKSQPSTLQSELQATPALSDAPATDSPDVDGAKSIDLQSPTGTTRPPALPGRTSGEEGGEMRFWVVAHDYDPREVAFNSDGVLVGGSLRVLVEKMTPHDGMPDANFATAFWYTFRLFCTPAELVETLTARYELKPPPVVEGMDQGQLDIWVERKLMPVRLRVYNFIKSWLDQHWRPESDNAVLESLEAFALNVVSSTLPGNAGPRLADQVRKRQAPPPEASENGGTVVAKGTSFDRIRSSALSGMLHAPMSPSQVPTPVITKALHGQLLRNPAPSGISILDFDTVELARQLTIMESKLFAAVAPEDLLMTGKKPVPELKALSTLSNQITGWVADGILNEQDAKHRAALLKFYIKLADKCLALNNFSTLFAVLAGLNSSTIMRLKKTWDVLSVKYRLLMERLRGVIEHTKNHAAYRARLREVTGPCLPFLGLILSDITFTQDGNPNTRPSTLSPDLQLINQDKFTKLGRIAADFRRYQMPFDLKELEPVQQYLQRVLAERGSGSLDALYRKSLLLEPRQGSERLSSAVEKPGWLGVKL